MVTAYPKLTHWDPSRLSPPFSFTIESCCHGNLSCLPGTSSSPMWQETNPGDLSPWQQWVTVVPNFGSQPPFRNQLPLPRLRQFLPPGPLGSSALYSPKSPFQPSVTGPQPPGFLDAWLSNRSCQDVLVDGSYWIVNGSELFALQSGRTVFLQPCPGIN